MTERLAQLMHDEARDLDVPPPPASSILARGRRVRRRHRVTTGLAALSMVTVVAGSAVLAGGLGDDRARDVGPASAGAAPTGPAFALGNTVYLDGGSVRATVDDRAVKSLYYTSVGVLVRHGINDFSDGGGPQRFSLVTPAGEVRPIDVATEDTVPGVDPDQPYLAYAVVEAGTVEVVVHDISTDAEVARVAVPDDFEGGWDAPPVAIDGDLVFVGTDTATQVVDWRTGAVSSTDKVEGPFVQVSGGRTVSVRDGRARISDAVTGELADLVDLSSDYGDVRLSPDGRYAVVTEELDSVGQEPAGTTVRTVGTGSEVTLDGPSYEWGWTANGELFRLTEAGLDVCTADTGDCRTDALPDGVPAKRLAEAKLGGRLYES